jgi:hypothetical protein
LYISKLIEVKGTKMDFTRGVRPNNISHSSPTENAANTTTPKSHKPKRKLSGKLDIFNIVLLVSLALLILFLLFFVVSSKTKSSSDIGLVSKDGYQAVFLTNGQVYFGKIAGMDNRYIRLQEIYYLSPNQAAQEAQPNEQQQNPQYQLVKLGCELHGPQDQMIIQRDQVTFWENLKDEGTVVKGVKDWKSQNPKGLECNTNNQGNSEQNNNNENNDN